MISLQPFIDLSAQPVYKSVVGFNALCENSCHIGVYLGNVSMAKKCLQVNVVFVDVGRVWILIIFAMRDYE